MQENLPAKRSPGRPKKSGYDQERRDDAIVYIASGMPIAKVAEVTGISQPTLWRWYQEEDFQREVQWLRRQKLTAAALALAEAMMDAVATLHDLAKNAVSESVRERAANNIITHVLGQENKLREEEREEEKLRRLEKMHRGLIEGEFTEVDQGIIEALAAGDEEKEDPE